MRQKDECKKKLELENKNSHKNPGRKIRFFKRNASHALYCSHHHVLIYWGRRGRYHMVDGFTTTYGIGAYHHQRCEFESRSWRGVLDTTLCDKVYQ